MKINSLLLSSLNYHIHNLFTLYLALHTPTMQCKIVSTYWVMIHT